MIIVDIEEISKSKVKVSADNGTTFSLYKSELKKYGISPGEEFTQQAYTDLVDGVLAKRAKLRCMNLLKSRDYTRYEIENKLKSGCYPKEVIDIAVQYVMSYGYIDDMRYAKAYIGYKSSSKSARQIKNELMRKGITPETIDMAFDECLHDNNMTDEETLIKKLLEKKKYDKESATALEKQKIAGFLYRKGFSSDLIYRLVE